MDVLWWKKNIEMDDLGVPPFIESLQDGVWQGLVPSGVIWRWDLPEILEGDNSAKSEI
jgi:hypothetical protein